MSQNYKYSFPVLDFEGDFIQVNNKDEIIYLYIGEATIPLTYEEYFSFIDDIKDLLRFNREVFKH